MPFVSTTETAKQICFFYFICGCVTTACQNAHRFGKACLSKIINYLFIQCPLLFHHNPQSREELERRLNKDVGA